MANPFLWTEKRGTFNRFTDRLPIMSPVNHIFDFILVASLLIYDIDLFFFRTSYFNINIRLTTLWSLGSVCPSVLVGISFWPASQVNSPAPSGHKFWSVLNPPESALKYSCICHLLYDMHGPVDPLLQLHLISCYLKTNRCKEIQSEQVPFPPKIKPLHWNEISFQSPWIKLSSKLEGK